jgi:hypothetical protein
MPENAWLGTRYWFDTPMGDIALRPGDYQALVGHVWASRMP